MYSENKLLKCKCNYLLTFLRRRNIKVYIKLNINIRVAIMLCNPVNVLHAGMEGEAFQERIWRALSLKRVVDLYLHTALIPVLTSWSPLLFSQTSQSLPFICHKLKCHLFSVELTVADLQPSYSSYIQFTVLLSFPTHTTKALFYPFFHFPVCR